MKEPRQNSPVKIAQGMLKEPLPSKVLPMELSPVKEPLKLTIIASKRFKGMRIHVNNKKRLKTNRARIPIGLTARHSKFPGW